MTRAVLLVLIAGGCKGRPPAPPPPTPPEVQRPVVLDAGAQPSIASPLFEAPVTAGPLWREIAASGLGLAFTSERSGTPQLHRLDGATERALTNGSAAHHLQAISLRVNEAIVSRVEGAGEALVAVSLGSGRGRELMQPLEKAHAAQLSWTEELLVFESSLTHASSLAVLSLDGGEPTPLPELGQTGSFQPSFTRDGRVLFTSSASGDPELYVSNVDGGAPTQLTAFHLEDFGAVASPDGRRFAFLSNREGVDRVFIQGLDGRNVTRLSNEPRANDEVESDPVWMPDGASVLVTIRAKQQSRIARIDVATHRVVWSTKAADADQLPRPSPDGRFIAFVSDRLGNADVFVMRANGQNAEALTTNAAAEYGPRWFKSAPSRH